MAAPVMAFLNVLVFSSRLHVMIAKADEEARLSQPATSLRCNGRRTLIKSCQCDFAQTKNGEGSYFEP